MEIVLNKKKPVDAYLDTLGLRFVGDENLRDGLLQLSEVQVRIIEAVVFDGVGAMNLRYELGLSVREIRMEVKRMRNKLLRAM